MGYQKIVCKKKESGVLIHRLLFLFVEIKSSVKSINTSAGINQFLSASKERMAFRTNFNFDVFFGRTDFNYITASTCDCGFFVIWMNSWFHDRIHLQEYNFYSNIPFIKYSLPIYDSTTQIKKQAFFLNFTKIIIEMTK